MKLSRASRLLLLILWSFFAATSAGGNETDRISLLELKAKIIDPNGAFNAWNKSTDFCEWPGVKCGRRHQRVTALSINSSQLSGHLSPFIGNLSFLRILDLKNNSFSHQIPEEIGRLHRLQIMYLQNNSFNGKIPANLSRCFSLRRLNLGRNKLVGEIPPEIGSQPNLELLHLASNNLHGEIPSTFANFSNTIKILYIDRNYLSGHIPSSLGRLKVIESLSLGENNLSGIIPPLIYNLSLIRMLSVETNKLHGELPSRLGHMLMPKLEIFLFHSNQFSGPVPDISNASNLNTFSISVNNLTGKVPKLLNIPNLGQLLIDKNNLGSDDDDDLDFLVSLVNCTNLKAFDISHNRFGGKLPEYVGNFSTKLRHLSFGSNSIKGSIPTVIENLVNLEVLGFEYNQMVGPIPASVGKLQKLGVLSFINNEFTGSIPSTFGNLTLLIRLYLGSNNLQGVVPLILGKCNQLEVLSLEGNNFTGPIPKEVVGLSSLSQFLDLSNNHFTGSIPNEVGQLVNLGALDFSGNKLSGELPESLGRCQVLEYLFLEGNFFQGSIPKSISELKGLTEIDFSRNNLSGKLPIDFENLNLLKRVNFSFNNFEGEIPAKGIFANASAFWVKGNPMLCGGIAELGFPKCLSVSNNNNKHSSKVFVLVACGLAAMLLLVLLTGLILLNTRKRIQKTRDESPLGVSLLEVSYGDLVKATNGFSATDLIGTGSFGSVYKATILAQNNPLTVAVKVLNLQASRALKSFISECKVLGSIKHRNIVKLITACSSIDFQGNDFKALVYEFMTNGSLEEWLHPRHANSSEQGRHLNFIQRLKIAIDVAAALDHLHNNSHVSIVHSDLKPGNILLDGDMNARIGDFGLARFLEDPSTLFSSNQSSSIGPRGSIGYIAPEYSMGGELSSVGDVYSYGILLLEMFTQKRPTDEMFRDSFNLHNYVKRSLPERLSQIVDSSLLFRTDQIEESHDDKVGASEIYSVEGEGFWKCLQSILNIGVSCSEERPTERMSITDVVKELQHIKIP